MPRGKQPKPQEITMGMVIDGELREVRFVGKEADEIIERASILFANSVIQHVNIRAERLENNG